MQSWQVNSRRQSTSGRTPSVLDWPHPVEGVMTKKHARQAAILELVGRHVVGSQEDLRQLLLGRGMDVTQATLSRDLRDLGLARVPTEDGGRYVLPDSLGSGEDKPLLGNLLPQLLSGIDGVCE